MNKIRPVLILIGSLLAFGSQGQARFPNVILIMTDDQGYGDFGFTGNAAIKTPHTDRLAAESLYFSNFYVAPVCAPTRASLLTGRYHQRTGVRSVTNGYETMATDEKTIAEYLKELGYRTGLFGKWHLGENYPHVPQAQGFDRYLGFRTGHLSHYFDPELEENGKVVMKQGYVTDILTDAAISFIRQNKDQPFFCYIPYNAPHTPLDVPEKYWKHYAAKGFDEDVARVYGMIENLDENLGRIMSEVKSLSLEANTLIIYLSDNGPIFRRNNGALQTRYNAGLRDMKFTIYDGGIKTPALFYWRNRIKAGTNDTPVAHIDLLPTILELTGYSGTVEKPLDGLSLASMLPQSKHTLPDRYLFLNYSLATLRNPAPYPGGIVRTTEYKMVNGTELYAIKTDRGETTNVADQYPRIVNELDSAYRAWWSDVHERGFDRLPIEVGHREEPVVRLAPHLGQAFGGLKFLGMRGHADKPIVRSHPVGVDSDWLSNWRSRSDSVRWTIRVVTAGRYAVRVVYRNHAKADASIQWQVKVNGRVVTAKVSGQRVKEWKEIEVGEIDLSSGDVTLVLSAEVPDGADPEVERVEIVRW